MPATRTIGVRVGPAGDTFEREAGRWADAIAGGGARPSTADVRLQRALDEPPLRDDLDNETDVDDEEDVGDASGRPKFEPGASRAGGMATVPVGASSGDPLPLSVRAPLAAQMGHDFSGVRVHTGGDAARAAASVHARAFTVGSDIYFDLTIRLLVPDRPTPARP